ncbi:MAG: NHL repeat-containing protein [Candidatus Aminicenantes bacterium]|nr:NHL repeat-containing protein [Candidatus Aminicenantes bacterium]
MRKKAIAAAALSATIFVSAATAQVRPLADVYKTGRVKLIEEIRVSDRALPEGIVFQSPGGVAVDDKGRVYVADFDAHHLKVFGADGKFLRTIGRKGQGPGDFQGPASVEIGGGRIYIWESTNRRISVFDAEGKFIASTPFNPGAFGAFIRMRALPDDRLVVYYERGLAEGSMTSVPDGQDRVVELLSAEAKPMRTLYERKVRSSRLAWVAELSRYVRVPFPYHPAVAMDVTPAGLVAVGLNDKNGFEVLDPDQGRLAAFSRPYQPVRLTEKDKQDHFGRFRMTVFKDNVKTVLPKPPEYIVKNTEFPDVLPAFRGLVADGEGFLWVHVYVESRATNVFDIFDLKNGFLARISVEGASVGYDFTSSLSNRFAGGALWMIERDEDGYISLVKYRLASAR